MPYATVADFVEMFGEAEAVALSNLDRPEWEEIAAAPLEKAIADASALIDSYLRSAGYTLPLSAEVLVLQRCACDIARYYLDRLRAREDVKARYDSWLKWLSDVAKRVVELGVPPVPGEPGLEGGDIAESWGCDRVFTFGTLRDY